MISKLNGCINIDGLVVFAHHGVYEEEKNLGQKFVLDVKLGLDIRKPGRTVDLDQSVHYGELSHFIMEEFARVSHDLIETAVSLLIDQILAKYPVLDWVELTVKKPWAPINLPLDTVSVQLRKEWVRVYLSIGSNIGDKRAHLNSAIERLGQKNSIRNLKSSIFLETPAWGVEDQDDFLNAALGFDTYMAPIELLDFLQGLEKELGREETYRWGPRVIDLDILLYGQEKINSDRLIVPHARMTEREFVLEPLMEIAPNAIHPYEGKSIRKLFEELNITKKLQLEKK